MDELLKSVLPGLGPFAPFAVLAWWIISSQAKQLEARDTQNRRITEQIVEALTKRIGAPGETKRP